MKFPLLDLLIDEFRKFPGIGPKSASRLAFYILDLNKDQAGKLTDAIKNFKKSVKNCPQCGCLSEYEYCPICSDDKRDDSIYCVVETVKDLLSIDRTDEFRGLYHVLGGVLTPLEGIGPENLRISHLIKRLKKSEHPVSEVILATNPTLEGEATAQYISDLIKNEFPDIRVSRIAHGIQTGGELEYADLVTLKRSIKDRRTLGD
jgi:recombination protein RecR